MNVDDRIILKRKYKETGYKVGLQYVFPGPVLFFHPKMALKNKIKKRKAIPTQALKDPGG